MTTPLVIRQERASPATAKSVRLFCPRCPGSVEVTFPTNATQEIKTRLRHDAITEHARVCTGGTAEVERVYTMEYPRL